MTEKDGVFQNHYGISSASQTPPGFIGFNPNRWNEQTSVGTLYVGELEGGGLLQYTRSVYTVLIGALASVSLDLDEKGLHRIRWVGLVSQTADDDVRRLSEGFLPEGSRAQINPFGGNRSPIGAGGDDLGFYYNDSIQYEERNLSVLQLIGEHDFRDFNGLKVDWGLSYSLTSSDVPRRTESHYLRFVDAFEPNVTPGFGFETGNDAVGEMLQEIERSIDQDEIGARVDLAKDLKLLNRDSLFRWGFFYNKSDRAVRGSSQVVQANDRAANFTNFTFVIKLPKKTIYSSRKN